MAKSAPQSAERAALAQAHDAVGAAQQALTDAEDAHSQTLSAWAEASRDAHGIEKRLARLLDRRDPGIRELRWQYAEEVDAARAELKAEEERTEPFKAAYDAAKARIPEAERTVTTAQDQVTAAARRVACAEAIPVARACIAQLEQAYAVLLEAAPDLLCLVDKTLLLPDLAREAETAAGGMLRRASGCSEIEARYRRSPWRMAVERL
jgi:chromosome segregation ATPase